MELLESKGAGLALPIYGDVLPNSMTRAVVAETDVNTDSRSFSGWLTTENVDRYKTVLLARGAQSRFSNYLANPIICWAHDQKHPIGTVAKPQLFLQPVEKNGITSAGIYLEDAKLQPSACAQDMLDYFWMCVKEKTVKGLSIGAMAYAVEKMKTADGSPVMAYSDYETLEGSLAPIPVNPQALITSKSLMRRTIELCNLLEDEGKPVTIEEFGKLLIERGEKFELPTYYGMQEWKPAERAIQTDDGAAVDAEASKKETEELAKVSGADNPQNKEMLKLSFAEAVSPLTPAHRDYETLRSSLFALQKGGHGVFPLGGVDDNGEPKLHRVMVLQALTFALGARNTSATFEPAERMEAVERICSAMREGGMAGYIPRAHGLPVDKLADEVFKATPYSAVEWPVEAEKEIEIGNISDSMRQLGKSMAALDKIMPGVGEVITRYVSESYTVYVRPCSDKDRELISQLTAKIGEFDKQPDTEVNEDDLYYSADGDKNSNSAEAAKIEKAEVKDEKPAPVAEEENKKPVNSGEALAALVRKGLENRVR